MQNFLTLQPRFTCWTLFRSLSFFEKRMFWTCYCSRKRFAVVCLPKFNYSAKKL